MAQNYEDIVREWYTRLRPEFLRRLTARYSGLSLYDAENLYQDTFIAVQENLMRGRIKEDTSWSSYIMTIGLNLASKEWNKIGKSDSTDDGFDVDDNDYGSGSKTVLKMEEQIRKLSDEDSLYKNEEAVSILGNELNHTPEPCRSIIQCFYGDGWSMDEIADEIGYKNATTAKAKKSQCMNDLIKRVTDSLNRAGFDVTPKNGIAMERIDLYDKYINDQLSEKERADFDARLESDENFASDFKMYLFTVDGICREAHQDNLDFGLAMKGLSKDQLKEIIGKQDVGSTTAASIAESSGIEKPKVLRFKPWMWQAASIAAVVVIAFTVVLNIEKTARYSVDNAIYVCAEINPDLVRAGGEPLDVKSMSDDELKAQLPELISLYQSASNNDEVADNGYALAMAYLRLHDRDNAKVILERLVSRFDGNTDYAESVSRWKSILNLLK